MDTESLGTAPREVTLAGKVYLVARFAFGEWQALNSWLKDHGKDPVVAAMEHLTRAKNQGIAIDLEVRREFAEAATRQAKVWPPPVATEAWFAAMEQAEGGPTRFIATALRKCQPGLADAEVASVAENMTEDEAELLFFRVIGVEPPPKAGPPSEGVTADLPATTEPDRPSPNPTTGNEPSGP